MKKCLDCNQDELTIKFYVRELTIGGYVYRIVPNRCAECSNKRRAKQLSGEIPIESRTPIEWGFLSTRKCKICNISKSVHNDFGWTRDRNGRRYPRAMCKECIKKSNKMHQETNDGLVRYNMDEGIWMKSAIKLWRSARNRANQKGIPFTISPLDVIIPTHCPILGIELKSGKGRPIYSSPTIDRLNSESGYIPGNVSVISWRANSLKSNGRVDELEKIVNWMHSLGAR